MSRFLRWWKFSPCVSQKFWPSSCQLTVTSGTPNSTSRRARSRHWPWMCRPYLSRRWGDSLRDVERSPRPGRGQRVQRPGLKGVPARRGGLGVLSLEGQKLAAAGEPVRVDARGQGKALDLEARIVGIAFHAERIESLAQPSRGLAGSAAAGRSGMGHGPGHGDRGRQGPRRRREAAACPPAPPGAASRWARARPRRRTAWGPGARSRLRWALERWAGSSWVMDRMIARRSVRAASLGKCSLIRTPGHGGSRSTESSLGSRSAHRALGPRYRAGWARPTGRSRCKPWPGQSRQLADSPDAPPRPAPAGPAWARWLNRAGRLSPVIARAPAPSTWRRVRVRRACRSPAHAASPPSP